ncbi:GNAT family N-acetyltransferase [Pulveribacter sp.]|uniref:GNAT family N-acetyltransferase n=1 Tax=Pulveribacter sp. TaxID=2678893 RepID=UPI0028A1747E|nr:GNAT family N-acetyltransferase [Pulveribacter sp.]
MKHVSRMWGDLNLSLLPPALHLRPATITDLPFLRALYRTVRDPELALTPWTEAQKQAFSDSQFALQDHHYRKHYPTASFMVVEHLGTAVGRLYLAAPTGQLRLMDIALLPPWRRRGWGAALVRMVLECADRQGRETLLYVEVSNPAYGLYQREGFITGELEGVYVCMRRPPAPTAKRALPVARVDGG